ncbi:MAG: sensor histidine kinase KdpD [Proteobacteria bacterium]|nr:sensor histidine kinase KdpD [Pseudomonadota bacterium]
MAENTSTDGKARLTPAAFLELARNENRGKLKVFLGMAPGVGKTYAMLSAARALKNDGTDVVVGVVETHGRSETASLLDGLEVLPRRTVTYRKHTLMEFDVDAALERRPRLLLVDEFAHTNAPGLLHVKRYQDVEELLQAGIDVWTTLNIQHLESLTDVVERITGITVRETVPDKIIEKADEIVVIDLLPDELIKRLKEGKVYLPENARRAVDQFFKASNLTALRELALRRTADRVDEQMLAQLRQQGVEGPWPTAERLLVCIGGDDISETVVRAAARMAAALKSEWIAIHLAKGDRKSADRVRERAAEKAIRLAERLGATTVRIKAKDMAEDILNYARRNNITQIVIGKSKPGFLRSWFGKSLSQDVVERARDLAVTVIAQEPRKSAAPFELPRPHIAIGGALAASFGVGSATLIGMGLEHLTRFPNLSMVYLFAVLLCALQFGVWTGVIAAALSFLSYNFFFIEPRYTFTVAEPYELLSLFIFLVVAVVTGGLTGRLQEQSAAIAERAEVTQALYDFSRKLSGAVGLDDVLWLLAAQSAAVVGGRSVVLLRDGANLTLHTAWPPEEDISTSDWAAARWANHRKEPAGRLTSTLPSAQFQFRPLLSPHGVLGVVGIDPETDQELLPSPTESALQSFIEQAALAIERTQLVEHAAKAETAAEAERLRAALLTSVSHDLKTPLASIVGSVTSLRQLGSKMTEEDRADLLATIEEEANRMTRFVGNLLDMTKIDAGAVDIRRDWVDVADAIRGTFERAKKSFPKRKAEMAIAKSLPLVRGDAGLLGQVFFNLLDNADKYSGPQSTTRILARAVGRNVEISVSDDGIGIPPEALDKVFDKFYRVAGSDGRAPGTGLGLSIAAGLVKAMGGTIKAESPIAGGRGTRITITLPAGKPDDVDRTVG